MSANAILFSMSLVSMVLMCCAVWKDIKEPTISEGLMNILGILWFLSFIVFVASGLSLLWGAQ